MKLRVLLYWLVLVTLTSRSLYAQEQPCIYTNLTPTCEQLLQEMPITWDKETKEAFQRLVTEIQKPSTFVAPLRVFEDAPCLKRRTFCSFDHNQGADDLDCHWLSEWESASNIPSYFTTCVAGLVPTEDGDNETIGLGGLSYYNKFFALYKFHDNGAYAGEVQSQNYGTMLQLSSSLVPGGSLERKLDVWRRHVLWYGTQCSPPKSSKYLYDSPECNEYRNLKRKIPAKWVEEGLKNPLCIVKSHINHSTTSISVNRPATLPLGDNCGDIKW